MQPTGHPKSIEIVGEELLAIVWSDGHESLYPGGRLRGACPCAECRSRRAREAGAGSAGSPSLALAPPRIVGVDRVGNYALRLRWSDGHGAGLFPHRLLRELCPCGACGPGDTPGP